MSIDIEKLKAVTTLITHDNCMDGLATAMIVLDALPHVNIIFVQHNTVPYLELPATENMLFCDIIPPPARAQEFRDKGVIVLDHHKGANGSQEAITKSFEHHVFADEKEDPGVSGAVLALREVWARLAPKGSQGSYKEQCVTLFATLAGIRDTWQKQDPRWEAAKKLHLVLNFFPRDQWLTKGNVFHMTDPHVWESRMALGDVLLAKEKERVDSALAKSFRFTAANGVRVCMFQGLYVTSDAAEALGQDADLVLGWGYSVEDSTGPKVMASCRSHTNFNVAAFASTFGGGGHTKAAGFSSNVQSSDENPYAFFKGLVDGYTLPV